MELFPRPSLYRDQTVGWGIRHKSGLDKKDLEHSFAESLEGQPTQLQNKRIHFAKYGGSGGKNQQAAGARQMEGGSSHKRYDCFSQRKSLAPSLAGGRRQGRRRGGSLKNNNRRERQRFRSAPHRLGGD